MAWRRMKTEHASSRIWRATFLNRRVFPSQTPRSSSQLHSRHQRLIPATCAEANNTVTRHGIADFLNTVKWDSAGLVTVIAQDVDTGEALMQAFSDRAGIRETLETKLATFYSRSRKERWCKGETSGNFIRVVGVFFDCDRDSVIYLGEPDGPSCHTGAHSCWFSEAASAGSDVLVAVNGEGKGSSPLPTLLALERTIQQRRAEAASNTGGKSSWTAKLLQKPELLCSKIREEAGELCETVEKSEGRQRAASEMADLLYHSMVLLNTQGVSLKEVCQELRSRFGQSGIEEKAARPPKQASS